MRIIKDNRVIKTTCTNAKCNSILEYGNNDIITSSSNWRGEYTKHIVCPCCNKHIVISDHTSGEQRRF